MGTSLRARLLILMVLLVAAVVVTLFALQLNETIVTWLTTTQDRAEAAGQQVKNLVLQRLNSRMATLIRPPANLYESKRVWLEMVETDPEINSFLAATLAQTPGIVEISIAGENGRIIASSNPQRAGEDMGRHMDLSTLRALGPLARVTALLTGRLDYESVVVLGVNQGADQSKVMTIQVLVSTILLRDVVNPAVYRTAMVSLAALAVAILLAYLAADFALRPLARISSMIDRIASGEASSEPEQTLSTSREFAIVQSKLSLLGEQFRGAQQESTQLRTNVERLLERLEEAVLIFDGAGRLRVFGQAATRVLRIPRFQLAGRTLDEIFPETTLLGAAIREALLTRRPVHNAVLTWAPAYDAPVRLALSVEFLSGNNSPENLSTLVTVRDAEGRRQLESQLAVSNRLAAISRLTGGVAHEIKNPLNSIALRLELLRNRISGDGPEAEAEIDIIAQEVTRLDRVVKTFLDFTRPVEIEPKPVDLVEVLKEIALFIEPEAARGGVTLEYAYPERSAVISGDRDLLKQAVLNVVMNGLDAMPQGGILKLSLQRNSASCCIRIADTGMGIPPEARNRLFQLYFTTKPNGTGIGLAMTYRAVQLHGGTIEVQSEPGKGAEFQLCFPCEEDSGA